ncbi:hypothetical protein HDU92_003001 [Lobulomyces angularis]|nr:hypothetical protein HDU92_003001 [Lobulomyces angularis]
MTIVQSNFNRFNKRNHKRTEKWKILKQLKEELKKDFENDIEELINGSRRKDDDDDKDFHDHDGLSLEKLIPTLLDGERSSQGLPPPPPPPSGKPEDGPPPFDKILFSPTTTLPESTIPPLETTEDIPTPQTSIIPPPLQIPGDMINSNVSGVVIPFSQQQTKKIVPLNPNDVDVNNSSSGFNKGGQNKLLQVNPLIAVAGSIFFCFVLVALTIGFKKRSKSNLLKGRRSENFDLFNSKRFNNKIADKETSQSRNSAPTTIPDDSMPPLKDIKGNSLTSSSAFSWNDLRASLTNVSDARGSFPTSISDIKRFSTLQKHRLTKKSNTTSTSSGFSWGEINRESMVKSDCDGAETANRILSQQSSEFSWGDENGFGTLDVEDTNNTVDMTVFIDINNNHDG